MAATYSVEPAIVALVQSPEFPTTRWSMVLDAVTPERESRAALEDLCGTYWYPLYAFVRRRGASHEEAQDLVQAFFTRLVEKRDWRVDPARGRFRSFLAAALRNFLANDRDRALAEKRGGGVTVVSLDADGGSRFAAEPLEPLTPEQLFERDFALALLDDALERLRAEQAHAGKAQEFSALSPYLGSDTGTPPYPRLAVELKASEGALRVALHRLRRRYGELVRLAIADLVRDPSDVEEELSALLKALAR